MHIVTYRFFEIPIIVKVTDVINTHICRLSSVALLFFCVNSNSIRQIIKKAMLSLIHLKNQEHTSFPRSLRDFKI